MPRPVARTRGGNHLVRQLAMAFRLGMPPIMASSQMDAEGVGFEPTVPYETHALQACRFGRSRIPPGVTVPSSFAPPFGAVAGSCATGTREPSQGRKAAALSGPSRVPQSSLAAAQSGGPFWRWRRVVSDSPWRTSPSIAAIDRSDHAPPSPGRTEDAIPLQLLGDGAAQLKISVRYPGAAWRSRSYLH